MKRLKFVFILCTLFLFIGSVSAFDANSTDALEADDEDDPMSASNSSFEVSSCDEDVLTYKNDSSLVDDKLATSEDGQGNSSDNESSKLNLTIFTNTNYVKQGKKYEMYLNDADGHAMAGKKLIINYNGKTYKKTTDSDGKFSIKIDDAKKYVLLDISYEGDDEYNPFFETLKVVIQKSVWMEVGNKRLLTNGYLRIYLHGPLELIGNKKITIRVGNKVFTKKTTKEGFVVFKPKVSANKKHKITVTYGDLEITKKVKCIKGNVKNPFKKNVPMRKGVPDVDYMPKYFVMGYKNAMYVLKKSHYLEVMKRDSYSLFLFGKLSKYTFFRTKYCPHVYHILKREKWNVIEREIYTIVVKKNRYNYWPNKVTVYLQGKSYTYSEVRDIQNTGYTCGPTSASVCTQVLKNFHSERYFQVKGHVTNGINIPVLKKVMEKNHCSAYYFYYGSSFNNAIKQLKHGAALIVYLPNHYISVIDVSPDGKKVLVSNSYGSYDVGSKNVPTNWVSVNKLKSNYGGVGMVIKPKYKLSKKVKKEVKHCYNSMGGKWKRQNTKERIPNIGL